MTEADAVEAILEMWDAGWEVLHPGSRPNAITGKPDITQPLCVPWCGDDERFAPDTLGALGSWARIVVRPATAEQQTQGPTARTEYGGAIMVQVFGPLNQATKPLTLLADDIRTVLARKRSGTLRTFDGASTKPLNDGAWAMRVVVVEYRYTDV